MENNGNTPISKNYLNKTKEEAMLETVQAYIDKSLDEWNGDRLDELKKEFGSDFKKPAPEDFGIDINQLSTEQLAYDDMKKIYAYNRKQGLKQNIIGIGIPLIGSIFEERLFPMKSLDSVEARYAKYNEKLKEYQKCVPEIAELKEKMRLLEIRKKEAEYWFSLDGWKFEEEVSKLFLKSGQCSSVVRTKGSGDGGIDLILTANDGTKTLVQCKAHKKEVGPHIARDLYGAMHSAGINTGMIISLGGFTQGVRDFIAGKDISIVDVNGVIKLQKMVSGN